MAGSVGAIRVPAAPEDFHGDGRGFDGDVNVVYTDRLLLGNDKSVSAQERGDVALNGRSAAKSALVPQSKVTSVGIAERLALW